VPQASATRHDGVMTINTEPGSDTSELRLGYGYDNLGRFQTVTDDSLATSNATTYHYRSAGFWTNSYIQTVRSPHAPTRSKTALRKFTLTRRDSIPLRSFQ
jgi:hypothetical protein